jgi:hypothetical protein
MDITGCPPGFATDRAFLRNQPTLCDVDLNVFWSTTMFICIIRTIAFFLKSHAYLQMNGCKIHYRRIVSVVVSLWSVIAYFLSSILAGLSIANAANGGTFALYSLTYLPFIIDFTMMLFKIVRLGKGVIALPKSQDMGNTDYLSKFTGVMTAMVSLQIALAMVSTIMLIILSPVYPDQDIVFGIIGFASKGSFQILCTFVMVMVR